MAVQEKNSKQNKEKQSESRKKTRKPIMYNAEGVRFKIGNSFTV